MKHEITLIHETRDDGGLTKGTAVCDGTAYEFQIKHYDEPSEHGIDGGRISKLWLRRWGENHATISYDRGWERGMTPRGKGAEANAVYKAIIAKFN